MKQLVLKKMLAVVVLGIMTVSTVFASDADDKLAVFKLTAKPSDIVCEGKTTYERAMWERIVTLGLLNTTYEKTEKGTFPAVPGGVDAIRLLLDRNPEMPLVFAKLGELVAPAGIKSDVVCTSPDQAPLKVRYFRNDSGKTIYEIDEGN